MLSPLSSSSRLRRQYKAVILSCCFNFFITFPFPNSRLGCSHGHSLTLSLRKGKSCSGIFFVRRSDDGTERKLLFRKPVPFRLIVQGAAGNVIVAKLRSNCKIPLCETGRQRKIPLKTPPDAVIFRGRDDGDGRDGLFGSGERRERPSRCREKESVTVFGMTMAPLKTSSLSSRPSRLTGLTAVSGQTAVR